LSTVKIMIKKRNKPYYSKKQICRLVKDDCVHLTDQAFRSAHETFGWGLEDIKKALMKLPLRCCYKSEPRFNDPEIWVDYYRVNDLLGERVYLHFYIESEKIIIDSLKEL